MKKTKSLNTNLGTYSYKGEIMASKFPTAWNCNSLTYKTEDT